MFRCRHQLDNWRHDVLESGACVYFILFFHQCVVCLDTLTYPHYSFHSGSTLLFTALALFVYGVVRFHGSITITEGRWFSDNPRLCSHTARGVTLALSHTRPWLEAARCPWHSHTSLYSLSPALPPSSRAYFILKKHFTPQKRLTSRCDFSLADRHRHDFILTQNVIFSGESCNQIFLLVPHFPHCSLSVWKQQLV